jgi:hypothetical protein
MNVTQASCLRRRRDRLEACLTMHAAVALCLWLLALAAHAQDIPRARVVQTPRIAVPTPKLDLSQVSEADIAATVEHAIALQREEVRAPLQWLTAANATLGDKLHAAGMEVAGALAQSKEVQKKFDTQAEHLAAQTKLAASEKARADKFQTAFSRMRGPLEWLAAAVGFLLTLRFTRNASLWAWLIPFATGGVFLAAIRIAVNRYAFAP